MKYTYLCVECQQCKAWWPLYYATGERADGEMQDLWKALKSSALLGSNCPSNHQGNFWFPDDFALRCLEDPPSKYPSAIGLDPSNA